MMAPRITLVTLGVADVARSRAFYERLGWRASAASQPRSRSSRATASRSRCSAAQRWRKMRASKIGRPGFSGVTLAYNARSKEEVDRVFAHAVACGATAVKPPHDVFWGGYSGYFADPDGHLWEVAWNPFFPLDDEGNLSPSGQPTRERSDRSAPLGRHVLVPAVSVVGGVPRRRPRRARHRRESAHRDALLIQGSLGSGEGLGFTLFYATNFIFTGLAVAVAYHAGLFNIGGEGQATLGGLGAALVVLNLGFLPGFLLIPLGILGAAAFGAAWAAVPGYLQAKRGSHIVITTIMFNWLASVLIVYLLVNVLREPTLDEPGNARVPAAIAHPVHARGARRLRHHDPALAAQPDALSLRSRPPSRSGS